MGDRILSFVEFELYCKFVLRKHLPEGYKHLRIKIEKTKKDDRVVSILAVLSGEQGVLPCFVLEEQYAQYLEGMTLKDLTKVMAERCVQAVKTCW